MVIVFKSFSFQQSVLVTSCRERKFAHFTSRWLSHFPFFGSINVAVHLCLVISCSSEIDEKKDGTTLLLLFLQ